MDKCILSAKEKIASILLFIPVILRWMPYRSFSIVTEINGFPYFWPCIFFALYMYIQPSYLRCKEENMSKKAMVLAIPLCFFSLLFSENATHFFELFIKCIFFYTIPYIFLYKPLSRTQLYYVKY